MTGLRGRGRRRQRALEDAAQLARARELADEDTTLLGEQLARLGVDQVTDAMDEPTRADYQAAVDAHESAERAVPGLASPEDVSTVMDVLSAGRYALACVHARLDGRPIAERRVPCFFNPQHGPSVTDVLWTAPGRGTQSVPACAEDAAHVSNGEQPEIRMVRYGSTHQPYWEAGADFLPYGKNYYSAPMLDVHYRHTVDGTRGGF